MSVNAKKWNVTKHGTFAIVTEGQNFLEIQCFQCGDRMQIIRDVGRVKGPYPNLKYISVTKDHKCKGI